MKRRGWQYLVIVAGALLVAGSLGGCALGEALGEALEINTAVAQPLLDTGLVDKVEVKINLEASGGKTRKLVTLALSPAGTTEPTEADAARLAGIVLEKYPKITEVDELRIAFGDEAQAGGVKVRSSRVFAHSPEDWRQLSARVAR